MFRPLLLKVNCAGVAHAAPAVLIERVAGGGDTVRVLGIGARVDAGDISFIGYVTWKTDRVFISYTIAALE